MFNRAVPFVSGTNAPFVDGYQTNLNTFFQRMLISISSFAFSFTLFFSPLAKAELVMVSDKELHSVIARTNLPELPVLGGVGFNFESPGIELDLDIQASIDSIEWIDEDGVAVNGEAGEPGSLILKGLHMGSSQSPITAERVRSETPFKPDETAMVHGLLIQSDTENGTVVTVNQLGDAYGNGLDVIVNDIYFGQDLTSQGKRGLGLLLEDVSNFISDDYVNQINETFNLSLSTIDDGMNTLGGNYYPMQFRMKPLETGGIDSIGGGSVDQLGELEDLTSLPGFSSLISDTSMMLDAQFVLYIDKVAIYRDNWEAGIKGFMVYQGIDTNLDGIEDTIGPATLTDFKMQTIQHALPNGKTVQAMHLSNIDFKADIAMANIYIGNPETGSLGAIHINDLHIHDTQLWIYPHD